jgi:hypothetical protein
LQAHLVFLDGFLIGQFLAPRLHGKVTLPERYQRFAGIGVLNDEITGVAGKLPLPHWPLRPGTDVHHIADFRKMVGDRMGAVDARIFRFFSDRLKVAENGIFQHTR